MIISEIKGYGSGDCKAEKKHDSGWVYPVFSTDDWVVGRFIDRLQGVFLFFAVQ